MSHQAALNPEEFDALMAPMADLAGLGYWQVQADNGLVSASRSFLNLIGESGNPVQWAATDYLPRFHSKDRSHIEGLLASLRQGQSPVFSQRLRLRHESGIWHWFQIKGGLVSGRYILTFGDITEFKEIEAAAMDSQLRYRSLYNTSPLAIILWNKEGQITEWNRRAESTFGWLAHEVVGRPIHKLLFTETGRETFADTVKALSRGDSNGRCTTDNLTKSGQKLRCQWNNVLLRNNQGTLIGIMSLVVDETETWLMECELRKNEAMYRALVETSPDAIFLLDPRGVVTMANYQAARLYGADDLSELIGSPFHELLPEGSKSAFYSEVVHCGDDHIGLIGNKEMPFRQKDGQTYDAEISYTATTNHEGRANGLIVVGRDVTQRKRIQRELKAHRDHLEQLVKARTAELELAQETLTQIIEGCPVPIFVVNTANVITHWNRACELALGAPATTLLGTRNQWQPFYPAHRPVLADLVISGEIGEMEQLYAGKFRASSLIEEGYEATDFFSSLNRWFHFTAAPIKNGEGKVVGAIETLVDITASKEAEKTLIEAKQLAESAARMKAEFLANMSHEIRTPLNAVIGLTRLLRQTELDHQQQDYADKVFNASRMLLALLNDLLDFSKIEAGQLKLESTEFVLDELLDNVATVVQTPAREKGLELHFVVDPAVPPVLKGDALRLTQVLVNLLSNAVKFTAEGFVAVLFRVLQTEGNQVKLAVEVQDTGVGLTPEEQSKLFQAFSQADTSTSRKFGGTGLGLIICRRLVELMGGEIWLDSVPGVGSTFTFTGLFGLAAVKPALESFPNRKALVLDDHPLARGVLVEQLRILGCEAVAVESIAAFMNALQKPDAHYDWLFLDWLLPDGDGHSLARSLRQTHPHAQLIMVTATDPHAVHEAAEPGLLNAILTKPLILKQLARTLSELSGNAPTTVVPTAPQYELAGMHILVVDDIQTNRFIASELIRSFGAQVELADSGANAIEMIGTEDSRYDLVLMDVQMPDMDGIETTATLKANPALEALPIIAMTAHAMEEEKIRCRDCGMVDFVGKPIDPDLLLSVLKRWGYGTTGKLRITRQGECNSQAHGNSQPSTGFNGETDIPGIDVPEGLRRMMNKPELFERVLKDFYLRFCNEAQSIQAALAAGDRATAERLAHSIKGLGGSIGARELQATASHLEEALYNNAPDLEEAFCVFSSTHATLMDSLRRHFQLD